MEVVKNPIDMLQKMKDQNIQPDWDGYGAEPPNRKSFSLATIVLNKLIEWRIFPRNIGPSVVGGIGITISNDHGNATFIECENDGEITIANYYSRKNGDIDYWEASMNQLDESVGRIYEHLFKPLTKRGNP